MNPANSGQLPQAGNGGAAQPANGQRLYRAEHLRQMPFLSEEDIAKYEKGLRSLWASVESNGPDAQEARKKIFEFSMVLHRRMLQHRMLMQKSNVQASQAQTQRAPGQTPASQQRAGQPVPAATSQRPATTEQALPAAPTATSSQLPANQAAPQAQQPRIPEHIMSHLNQMSYHAPPQITVKGAEEVQKWQKDMRSKYATALIRMEQFKGKQMRIDQMLREKGASLPADDVKTYQDQKEIVSKQYQELMKWVDQFRKSQELLARQAGSQTAKPGAPQATSGAGSVQNTQNVTATVTAAIEAAKNQQPPSITRAPISGQPQSAPGVSQAPSAVTATTTASQATIKTEPSTTTGIPPAVNTALASTTAGSQMNSSSTPTSATRIPPTPQTAATPTSATTAGINHANRPIHSAQGQAGTSGGTPSSGSAGVIGATPQSHLHPHPGQPQPLNPKFQISKQLPEKATQLPTPVTMATTGRPTMTQGGGVAGGVIAQPAVARGPNINLEGESKHVLSKTKLDELCRQVCGGAPEGQDGNYLAPEVEELVLNLADNFVDDVIRKSCMIAKERGSKTLDLRDLQMILERSYNIRVPGYSSDELRTVRKVQPTNAWIAKMSAVQAAKVTARNGDL